LINQVVFIFLCCDFFFPEKMRCCSVCEANATQRCQGCETAYCSRKCQKQDWPVHKARCDRFFLGCAGCHVQITSKQWMCKSCRLNYYCSQTCLETNGGIHAQKCTCARPQSSGAIKKSVKQFALKSGGFQRLLARKFERGRTQRGIELFNGADFTWIPQRDVEETFFVEDLVIVKNKVNSCSDLSVVIGYYENDFFIAFVVEF
jgi:MYND finger